MLTVDLATQTRHPLPRFLMFTFLSLTFFSTASPAEPNAGPQPTELWAAVQHPPGVLFITPNSPFFPQLFHKNCNLSLPCDPLHLNASSTLNIFFTPPSSAFLFVANLISNPNQYPCLSNSICPPNFPNCVPLLCNNGSDLYSKDVSNYGSSNNINLPGLFLRNAWWPIPPKPNASSGDFMPHPPSEPACASPHPSKSRRPKSLSLQFRWVKCRRPEPLMVTPFYALFSPRLTLDSSNSNSSSSHYSPLTTLDVVPDVLFGTPLFSMHMLCGKYACMDLRPILCLQGCSLCNGTSNFSMSHRPEPSTEQCVNITTYIFLKPPFFFLQCSSINPTENCSLSNIWDPSLPYTFIVLQPRLL
ncbi:uncharacterized protein LOC143656136 isoform X1 [Tamandua tetradactyla]|uniref:uncharacterized protein LOC143656136 isoform X1 n=1 Tax=Tamandua tetradactyla TaxID=48850 RepID=UPI004053B29E